MKYEVKIGILAIVAATITILGYQFLKGKNVFGSSHTLYVRYDEIDQLMMSSPVFIRGFQVGTVSNISMDPADHEHILVELMIDKGIDIPKTTIAEIYSNSLLGGKAIDLYFQKPCSGDDCAKTGDYLQGRTKKLLDSYLGPDKVGLYMDSLNHGLERIQKTLSGENGNSQMSTTVRNVHQTIANLNDITAQLNSMLHSSSGRINDIVSDVNGLSNSIQTKDQEIRAMIDNMAAFSNDLRQSDIKQTMSGVNTTLADLQKTVTEARSSLASLSEVLNKVREGKGSLGKLANDPQLYDNLNRTSKNLDLLLQDFRLNPKRYVNVSVFGKKQKTYNLPEHDPAFPADSTGGH